MYLPYKMQPIINYEHFHCWKQFLFIRNLFIADQRINSTHTHCIALHVQAHPIKINKCGGNAATIATAAVALTATASHSRDHKELINHQYINRFSSFFCACASNVAHKYAGSVCTRGNELTLYFFPFGFYIKC